MDDEALRVEADALLDADDLRGELIQVQLARAALGPLDRGGDEEDEARVALEAREAQLMHALRPALRLEGAPARGEIVYARGVAGTVELQEIDWGELDALIALVRGRAPRCRRLVLHDVRNADGVAALIDALPSLAALELRDRHPMESGGGLPWGFAARAGRLEELAALLHEWTSYPIARALSSGEWPRLRRLGLSGPGIAQVVTALDGRVPQLEALALDGEEVTVETLPALLGIARRPLCEVVLRGPRLDRGALASLAVLPEGALRQVSVGAQFSIDEICALLEEPAAFALEELRFSGRCAVGGERVGPVSTPARALALEMEGEAIEALAQRLIAPALRTLTLGVATAAALRESWLDGVVELTLRTRAGAAVRAETRRPTVVRALTLDLEGRDSGAIVDGLDLSSLRRLEVRATTIYGSEPGDLAAFARIEAPRVRALRLVGPITDETIGALAGWASATGLVLLALVTTRELSARAVASLTDERRFPRLTTLVLGPWTKVDEDDWPRLTARFGAGLVRER